MFPAKSLIFADRIPESYCKNRGGGGIEGEIEAVGRERSC